MMRQVRAKFSTVGIGIVAGAAIGVLIGALFTGNVNPGLAIIFGTGIGVVIASVIDIIRRNGGDRGGEMRDE
jgi:uncharacterized membrane protein